MTRNTHVSLFACLLTLSACSLLAPTPDRSRHYVLSPLALDEGIPSRPSGASVAIGPVRVPAYLSRPQMVTRVAPNRLELSELHRWAEPLDVGVRRTVAVNVGVLLGTKDVVIFPSLASESVLHRVELTLIHFERDGAGNARLLAHWVIRSQHSGEEAAAGTTDVTEPEDGDGPEASVAALSRALATISREIVGELRRLESN